MCLPFPSLLISTSRPFINCIQDSPYPAFASTSNFNLHLNFNRAARKGNPEVVRMLVQRNAPLNVQNADGDTPLHWACKASKTAVIKVHPPTSPHPQRIDTQTRKPSSLNAHRPDHYQTRQTTLVSPCSSTPLSPLPCVLRC